MKGCDHVHYFVLQFFCTLLFAFFGGAAPPGSAAAANGIALAVLGMYDGDTVFG
jgi:hypothetical protein